MSKRGNTSSVTIILLIIGLVVGAGGGYLVSSNALKPTIDDLRNQVTSLSGEKATLDAALHTLEEEKSLLVEQLDVALSRLGETTDQVTIGMLCGKETSLSMMQDLAWIAEDEINRYCEQNGIRYRFEFILQSTQGQAAVALEKVQGFRSMGIDLVVAYLGSEYSALLPYINSNSMVFIDAVNTMPAYALPDDGLYRMHSTWGMQGNALAEDMWSLGKKAVIIIHEESPYMDELYDIFTARYVAKGGVIFAETILPPEVIEYSNMLTWLEGKIDDAHAQYGECRVGVQILAYTDFLSFFPDLNDYPTTQDVIWFGNEALANQPTLFMYQPTTAAKIKILSPSPFIDTDSDAYHAFSSAYSAAYGVAPSYEACLVYDSCWVMAKSVIAAGSPGGTTGPPDGDQVNPFVTATSNSHQGVTGWCTLDANGDRVMMYYDVWGYDIESGGFTSKKYGYYDGETDTTTWLIPLTGSASLFFADFEDDTVGSPPAPSTPLHYGPLGASLETTGDTTAFEVIDSVALGSKALKITRGYDIREVSAIVGDIGEMPYTSGVIYIDYWAHGEVISEFDGASMVISVRSEDGPAACVMRLYDGSYHILDNGAYIRLVGTYDPSTPHFVHIEINLDTRRYSIYIDSEELVTDEEFVNVNFTDMYMLNFWVAPTILEGFPTVFVVDELQITKCH